ncbi:hypothetical protein [Campylobacter vulpis]|uniref:hypothetical protein n=1 Tax=Campylobacter vulpis TaxID=1655500 RepID=UPI001BCDACCE|nr:hypothetical protein [Campylobacter vulpis]MBS4234782.1 hypothetical protein [Campylobacter vulpis]MBS4329380.1 hypothetical protein [Campylobacter vulpis]
MKKILYALLAFFLVLFVVIYGLIFSSFGNRLIANVAQTKVKELSGLDLNISHFSLSPSFLNLEANLNQIAQLKIEGNLSLLSLGFELDYALSLNKNLAKTLNLNLKENLELNGDIIGSIKDFEAKGRGRVFGSNLNYDARIYNFSPIALNLDAKNLKIEEILSFLNQAPYASGELNALAKISAKDLKPEGNAIIQLDMSSINYKQIQKDFNLNLPPNSNLKSEILAIIKDNQIHATSQTQNGYLSLTSQKTLYDLTNNTLNTDFKLQIPDLTKLESLTKTKLQGSLGLNGNLIFANNVLDSLNAKLDGLGGEFNAKLKDNHLAVLLNAVRFEKILALAGYGALANGSLNANLNSKGLDFKNFDLKANIDNGKIDSKELKKLTKLEFPQTNFKLNATANALNGKINYNALLASTLLNIKKLNGSYDLNNAELALNTEAFIEDLSKFNSIAGQKLQGEVTLNAKAKLENSNIQSLDANANLAGGTIKANSNGQNLNFDINKLDLAKLFIIAGQPNYASGILNAKGVLTNLDLKKLNGNVSLNAKGVLNHTTLSKLLEVKFPNNANYDLNAKANINNSLVNFDTNLNSSLANIPGLKGSFDLNNVALKSTFKLNLNDFSKLGFLLERKLSGKADFDGKFDFNAKGIDALLISENLFEAKLNASLKNNQLQATLNGLNLSSLAKGIDIIDLYQGKANANINYNLLNEKGDIKLDINEGHLKENAITKALQILTLKDVTKEAFNTAHANAHIDKEHIDFNLNMQAPHSHIIIERGSLNSKNGALNIPFDAKIDRANFKGFITGTSQKPKIKLDAGSVIKSLGKVLGHEATKPAQKAGEGLDKLFNKLLKDQ